MFIYNTTYVVPNEDARDFVIWAHQVLLPQVAASQLMSHGRLSRILSHKEEDSECFSVQFEAQSTADIHHWLIDEGQKLQSELHKMFDGRIVGFATLMEGIDGE